MRERRREKERWFKFQTWRIIAIIVTVSFICR